MFEYIKGKLVELTPAYAIVENTEIGYFIHISVFTYSQFNGKESITIYLHQVVREDAHLLYGFAEKSERDLFRHLISVSGIGANTARMMLSSLNPSDLRKAISDADVNTLKGIKGIGLKTAQRIVVDLRDKLSKIPEIENIFAPTTSNKDEALAALVSLGFAKNAAEKVLEKLISTQKDISVEDLVKKALKNL